MTAGQSHSGLVRRAPGSGRMPGPCLGPFLKAWCAGLPAAGAPAAAPPRPAPPPAHAATARRGRGGGRVGAARAPAEGGAAGARRGAWELAALLGAAVVGGAAQLCAEGALALEPPARAAPAEVLQAPPPILERSSERALKVGRALAERKAIMFGTFWCPYCDAERQELGLDVFAGGPRREALVRYVECDPQGVGADPELCGAAGVRNYPTWALAATEKDAARPFVLSPGAKGLSGLEILTGLREAPPAEAPAVAGTSGPRQLAVAAKLGEQGLTFYGTYWCGYCDMQRQLFGREAWAKVPYVECDPRCKGAEASRCSSAGVEAYPEWVSADGRHFSGLQSLDELEAIMGGKGVPAGKPAAGPTVLPMPGAPGADPACEDCRVPAGVAMGPAVLPRGLAPSAQALSARAAGPPAGAAGAARGPPGGPREEAAARAAEARADEEAARAELEAARALIARLEESRRREHAAPSRSAAPAHVGGDAPWEEPEEDRRLGCLRQEVERLQALVDGPEEPLPAAAGPEPLEPSASPSACAGHARAPPAAAPAQGLGALSRWAEDLRLLSASLGGDDDLADAAVRAGDGLVAPAAAAGGARQGVAGAAAAGGLDDCRPRTADVERQLNDILAEFDEIDRIHAGVRRLQLS
ncbi:unnamed protein product [Prorocentrum cordatum]|uniref:Thioredoxin domain-containing protein n=1 Tax=Prorocentrum cordatum TaxID=2364126 RepID=A0ABN9SWI0_9DINO|nr:unnamed protein product [Polarella glacialis]